MFLGYKTFQVEVQSLDIWTEGDMDRLHGILISQLLDAVRVLSFITLFYVNG